jgi:nucleotide-binding universal stress UspA family protein
MNIKRILTPFHDAAVDAVVIDAAAHIARQYNAHIETLLIRVSVDTASQFASSLLNTSLYKQVVDGLAKQVLREEREARRTFEELMRNKGIALSDEPSSASRPSASWRSVTGDPVELVGRYGGAFDLIVAAHPSQSSDKSRSSQVLDAAIFNTARPVLLTPKQISPTFGETILLAWNRGIPAGRALVSAEPFLEKAKRVVILTVTTQAKQGPEPEDIATNLAWKGISAEVKRVPPTSRSVAQALIEEAASVGADLLVMGAYSQSRLRERVLGGVTREIMTRADLPVLMAR